MLQVFVNPGKVKNKTWSVHWFVLELKADLEKNEKKPTKPPAQIPTFFYSEYLIQVCLCCFILLFINESFGGTQSKSFLFTEGHGFGGRIRDWCLKVTVLSLVCEMPKEPLGQQRGKQLSSFGAIIRGGNSD